MGYANNHDFLRQSSCVRIWQSYPDKPNTSANPEMPINSLIYDGHTKRKSCMKSSDNTFPWIAAKFHTVGDKVDFREISLWKVSFTLILFFLLLAKTADPASKLAFCLAFFLIFGDLANLLYANTLYLEFSVILGLFFSVLSTAILLTAKSKNTTLVTLAIVALAWLGFSKQQYMPLAIVLGIICSAAMFLKYCDKRLGITFLLIAAATPLIYGAMNRDSSGHMQGVNFANKTDTFLAAVLPESTNKEAALQKLGLPAECIKGIGKNWYVPGIIENHPCPEVAHVSRAKLIGIFISEPRTFFEPMRKAIIGTLPFYPDFLGHLAEPKDSSSQRYLLLKKSSLSYILAKLPADAMPMLALSSIALGIIAFAATLAALPARAQPLVSVIMFGGLVSFYSIFSSVFGDGYVDLQKHGVGFLVGVALQIAATGILLAGWLLRQIPSPKATATQA